MSFYMNNFIWRVEFVNPSDPMLVDRTGQLTVATTDPITQTVYLSNTLSGRFLVTVLIHELGHCAMISYGLIDDIHRMVYPKYWIDMEEWVCNFIANYGEQIFTKVYDILGPEALNVLPYEIEKLLN